MRRRFGRRRIVSLPLSREAPKRARIRRSSRPSLVGATRETGEIRTVSGGGDYAGKPRPIVIVQDDSFDATASITVCAVTTDETEAPLFRIPVQPNDRNGLRAACRLMVDKISTVPKSKIGSRIGRLDDEDILRLNQAALVFLGLASSSRSRAKA